MNSPAYAQLSDYELVSLHLNGDSLAFRHLFQRHYAKLWSVALRNTYCVADAEDALQDSMIKVHKVLGEFQWKSSLSSWLHRIVVNTCIDKARQSAKLPVYVDTYREYGSAVQSSSDRDTFLLLKDLLNQISPEHRIIIQLLDIEGYSLQEVSDKLDVPIGTVKSRRARARAKLAELYDAHNQ